MFEKVVPEVGLEPTSLAAADFESAASTNSTTRATWGTFKRPKARRQLLRCVQRSSVEKVSQASICPDCSPITNQPERCSAVPCVKVCGMGRRPAAS